MSAAAVNVLNGKGTLHQEAGDRVDLSKIRPLPSFNSRTVIAIDDELTKLAESIKAHGLISPITVVPYLDEAGKETGEYWPACGFRRLRAMTEILKLRGTVRVEIRHGMTPEQAAEVNLAENAQREDVRTADTARRAWQMVNGAYPGATSKSTRETVARAIGMSKGYVANLVRAWEALSPESRMAWYKDEFPTDFVVASLAKMDHPQQKAAIAQFRKVPDAGRAKPKEKEKPSVASARRGREEEDEVEDDEKPSGKGKAAKAANEAPTRKEVLTMIGTIREKLDDMSKREAELATARLDTLRWVVGDIKRLRA